ncbi:TIGR01244 family sulfur transferase [Jannaschia ovalis]|uniref:TIGR01244 family sulfur transferase n=1 Tax=Jannaschia ovalis TaxID=3038773 RepID=A0ABY8LAI9_9RHOB|nr:TIGR01244 family sulfur transferase [Jannaschia sp. GRR-S6-38]WGH78151.1 TIGR01244 family sulfur transferase [Jannaschia sp. GRR-S6-38]
MDLRPLDDTTFVAPQLEPEEMAALAAEGVTAVICNRPDAEVPPSHQAAAMQTAAEAAGLAFTFNPVAMPNLTLDAVEEQADAIDGAGGKVVAYCASGTRSAVLWALAMAGRMPPEQILAATEAAGFPLGGLRSQLDALAARQA